MADTVQNSMTQPYKIDEVDDEYLAEHGRLLATIQRELPDLTMPQLLKVVAIVASTCGSCHDAPAGCQCWNDE